jgi:hypothetical protein
VEVLLPVRTSAPPGEGTRDVSALWAARSEIGASAGVVWPAAPNPLVSGGVFAGLALRGDLAPVARLSFDLATSHDQQQGAGRVAFSRATGAAHVCLTLLRPWGRTGVAFGACARFEAGVLRAQAVDVVGAAASARPWLAPGVGPFASARLTRELFVELEVGVTAPLRRDDYRLLPDVDVLRVPPLSGGARLSVGHDLPR